MADFFFCIAAEWKQSVCKLILCHGIKNVALVFRRIKTFFQNETSGFRILLSAGIMAACDVLTSEFSCLVKKCGKFQKTVTVDTWIWCASVKVGVCEFVDNTVTEFVVHRENVVEHAKSCGNTSCVLSIRWCAAGTVARETALWIIIKLQSSTGTVIAVLNHQVGSYAGINSAAHGDHCFFLHIFSPVV